MNSTSDYVIGLVRPDSVVINSKARQSATIESLVLSELLSIWQNDDLDLETVLERIEMMEHVGWEHILRWLGHFHLWDGYRDEWEMTDTEHAGYLLENAKKFTRSKKKGRK